MPNPHTNTEPLRCQFADDPDLRELAELFLSEMDDRVQQLRDAFEQGATENLARLAHQLKGAGGGYGYPALSDAAAQLERAVKECQPLDAVRQQLESLIDLCQRATI